VGQNIVQKILSAHIEDGELGKGSEVGIRIDQTLTQDATGTMAYLQFESMDIPRVKTELSVSYVDHNTLQSGFENADDHQYLQTVGKKYGIYYSKAGNGICHQVHLERFGRPGKTLLGSDSHTPTGGGIGMIAIGAGGLDIAVAMAGGAFYIPNPKVCRVTLSGKLQPMVSAKDVILKLLEIMTTKGNVGIIVEYGGKGVSTLSVPERATITNMGAELGVTTSVFPSDDATKDFLKAQQRGDQWVELIADEDATYDQEISIDLGSLEPRVAKPHSPDNIDLVTNLEGLKVNQVLVGSCTNSSYKDLVTVAKLLKGKTVDPSVSFGVAPGSKQVLEMIAKEGYLSDIIASGARILESACGFCIGNGQAPGDKWVSIRSNNRNFFGRSGTKSADVYLASPEVCVAAALSGKLTDPRVYFKDTSIEVSIPDLFEVNDNLIESADNNGQEITILRGPNIGDPPKGDILQETIKGVATLKVGDKITTDHIMPAGPYLKYRSNVPTYSKYVFYPVDQDFANNCQKHQDKGEANIIIAGESYGQGSSREHAALCPMYLGVKAVVAKSMERIHKANLINFGIAPLLFVNDNDYDEIDQGDEIKLPGIINSLKEGDEVKLKNITKGTSYDLKVELTKRQKEILFAGGMLNMMKG
jgi:aconitate hydratase